MFKVSVVIPTYNRASSVKRLLMALTSQTFPYDDFEVIVSIDGSKDNTIEVVDNFAASYTIRTIWQPNSGRVKACNRGIEIATGEIIILLDDDMEPLPEFIKAHYSSHSSNAKLGVIGGAPILIDDDSTFATKYIASEFNQRQKKMAKPDYKFKIWDFYGGTFSIRRDILFEVGVFNESFKTYGYEDIELAQRLIESGVDIIFNPDACCIQHYDEDLEGLVRKTIYSGKRVILLVDLHPELFYELKLREYNLAGWKWRALRLSLMWAGILIPFTPSIIVFFIKLFGKADPKIQEKLYNLALDYFFWLGVWSEIKKDKEYAFMIPKIKSYRYQAHAL